jgi:HD-GYP domain-containing protein (c-di-GMP phosphodiesterase class II)
MGMDGTVIAEVHAAALLHDLGRTAVSSEIWNRAGPLGPADRERVRLHSYWTERVLARCPAIATLAPVAAAHHERLDGSGYHRGAGATELRPAARLLAAADAFAAMTESRPHRPALAACDAARELMASASKFDGAAPRALKRPARSVRSQGARTARGRGSPAASTTAASSQHLRQNRPPHARGCRGVCGRARPRNVVTFR